jgi:hypothetical protein
MAIISQGFRTRHSAADVDLPPGQYPTADFRVLSARPSPMVSLDQCEFTIEDENGILQRRDWKSFRGQPTESFTADSHGVTRRPCPDPRASSLTLPWSLISICGRAPMGAGHHVVARTGRDSGRVSATTIMATYGGSSANKVNDVTCRMCGLSVSVLWGGDCINSSIAAYSAEQGSAQAPAVPRTFGPKLRNGLNPNLT